VLNEGEVGESGDREGEQVGGDVVAEFAVSDCFSEDRLEFADEGRLRPEGRLYLCRASCGGSVVLVDQAAEPAAAMDRADG
jgi:hypothetical protein